jgi:hypothetical protein
VPALRSEVPRMETAATTPPTPEPELGTLTPVRNTTLISFWNWTAREAAWSIDVFARMFATIVVLRTVSQLVSYWWFPKGVFDASPTLVRGFGGPQQTPAREDTPTVDDAEAKEDDIPEFVMAFDGERFYRHHTRHAQQYWACPLLRRSFCRDCEWFVEDASGQPRCAAVMKLVLRYHEHYRYFTLDEIRTLLERGRPSSFA